MGRLLGLQRRLPRRMLRTSPEMPEAGTVAAHTTTTTNSTATTRKTPTTDTTATTTATTTASADCAACATTTHVHGDTEVHSNGAAWPGVAWKPALGVGAKH